MKKINLTSQFIILFIAVIMITSIAFTTITMAFTTVIANQEVYNRLSTYVSLINQEHDNDDVHDFPDMSVGILIKRANGTPIKKDSNKYVTDDDLTKLLNKLQDENAARPNGVAKGELSSHKKKVYYVCAYKDSFDSYTFVFTDDTYTNALIRNVGMKINVSFIFIVLLAVMIIYLWSNNLANRIKKIQNHLLDLPKNKYEIAYEDEARDEIGELSKSVELMRQEIYMNEKTKQEMLQNLSHDFKTPIAVIKSYAEAELDGMADEDTTKVILAQAEILRKKVNRLLQYNSLEYLEKDREFEDICMNELILEVVDNLKYQIKVDIEFDMESNVFFQGYRENWFTVVENIMDNAKRYAKGKIKIVLKPDRLRIYNDGDNIDEAFLNSVFKPYEKGSKGQFGLGMSIVQKTVNFFGYNLDVTNHEVGVSFIITK